MILPQSHQGRLNGSKLISTFIRKPSEADIKKLICSIKQLNLKEISYDDLVKMLDPCIKGYTTFAQEYESGTCFYRGTRHENLPEEITRVGYPPASKITEFQRCNSPKNPMFYCSAGKQPTFYELEAQSNDIILISKWVAKKKMLLNQALNLDYPNGTSLVSIWASDKILYKFFSDSLAKKVLNNEEYKLTAAISQLLLKGNIEGLIYPSVAYTGFAHNIVLKPTTVNRSLSLKNITAYNVMAANNGQFEIKAFDIATRFDDQKILWEGRSPKWFLKNKGDFLTMKVVNGSFSAFDKDGNEVDME